MFSVITIIGNILVICAVVRERYLKSATNYYIVSLAVADLLVGLVVMPFNTLHEITNNYWFFGQLWCDLWHSFDVFASTASINSLVVIALDRHSAISDPINYHTRWLTRHWIIFVTGIWICSAIISFPAIAYWRHITHSSANATAALLLANAHPYKDKICSFTEDTYYLLFSSLVSFYVPLSVMIFVYIRIYRAATRQMTALKTGQKVNVKSADGTQLTLRIHRGGYHRVDGTSGTGGGASNNTSGKSNKEKKLSGGSSRRGSHNTMAGCIDNNNQAIGGGAGERRKSSLSKMNSINSSSGIKNNKTYLLSPSNQQKGASFLIRTTSEEYLNTTTNGSSLSPSPTDDLRRFSFGNVNMNKYASECCLYSQTYLSAGTISSSQSSMQRPSISTIPEFKEPLPPLEQQPSTPPPVPQVAAPVPLHEPKQSIASRMIKFKLSTSSSKKDKKQEQQEQQQLQEQQQQAAANDAQAPAQDSHQPIQSQSSKKLVKKKSPTMSLRRLVLTSKNRLSGKKAAKENATSAAIAAAAAATTAAVVEQQQAAAIAVAVATSVSSASSTPTAGSANASPSKKNSSSPTPKGRMMTSFKRLSSRLKLRKTIRFKDKMNSMDMANNIATMTIPEIVYTESDDTIFQENLVYLRNTVPSVPIVKQPLATIVDTPTPFEPTTPVLSNTDKSAVATVATIATAINSSSSTDEITSSLPAAPPQKAVKAVANLDAILTLNSESDNLDEENDEAEDDDDVDYVNNFASKQEEKQQQQQRLLNNSSSSTSTPKYKTTNFGKCLTTDNLNDLKYSFLNQNDILSVTTQQEKLLFKKNSQRLQQLRQHQPNQQETIVAAAAAAMIATMPLNIKRIQKQIQLNPHTLQFYHQHYYQHHLELQQAQALRHYSKRLQQRQQQHHLTQQEILRARNDSTASAYSSSSSSNRFSKAKLISKKMKSFNITKKFCKFSREQKAAKTLGIVMGVFIICWLPFFIYNVITGVFKAKLPKSHELIYTIFTWLGFVNSGCNPIIYAFSSRDFRRAFYKILCPSSFMRNNQRLATRDCVSATEHTTLRLNSRRHAILNCHICQIYEATIQSNPALCPANLQQILRSSSSFSLNKITNAIAAAGNTPGTATGASSTSSAATATNNATTSANTSIALHHQQAAAVETTPLTSSLTHNRPPKVDKALNGLLKLNKITFEPSINSTTGDAYGYHSGDSNYERPVNMLERIRQRVLLTFSLTKKNSKQRRKRQLKSRSISTCDSIISRSSNSSSYNAAASIYKRKMRNSKKREQRGPLLKIYS